MKIKMPVRAIVALLLTLCVIVSVLTANALKDSYSSISLVLANKLNKIDKIVNTEYYFKVNQAELENSIVNGYVEGIGDKYASYYSESDADAISDKYNGNTNGIGMFCVNTPKSEIYVWRVYSGSAADIAGLKSGDVITKINSKNVSEIGYTTATEMFKQKAGTTVKITYLREDKSYNTTVTCGVYDTQSVYPYLLNNKYGLIQIITFNAKTYLQFKNAVEELKKQGAQSYIIDLRHNGGGTVDAAANIIDYLLPECDTIHIKDKNGKVSVRNSSDKSYIKEPIVILTDDKTASSAEILTAAMQDFGRASVIGTTTYGKSLIQRAYSLGDGSVVKLTIAEFVRRDGSSYNDIGIKPDIEINPDYSSNYEYYFSDLKNDSMIKAAINQLS